MKLFRCDNCGNALYFENDACGTCGRQQGYLAETNSMVSLVKAGDAWTADRYPDNRFHYCANAEHGACNWLIQDIAAEGTLCRACKHNDIIPDLSQNDNLAHWQTIERAKKRLFYGLIRFNLPLVLREDAPESGLAFRFLADAPQDQPVMTGHEDGMITLALVEADDAAREARRTAMGEPYRTLVGHFRHEIAHYYWDVLVASNPAVLDKCRAVFGDERQDYGEALERHYQNPSPPDWPERFVSTYATAHPWEDFAETWAHYFHLVDTIETASTFGLSMAPRVDDAGTLAKSFEYDPYRPHPIEELVEHWVPLSVMLNSLNRSIGQPDAYPFVLTPAITEKLAFIGDVIHGEV